MLLTLIASIQWRQRRRLEIEIQKRKESDGLLNGREDEYRAMVEGAPVAFMVWDSNLTISRWNHEAEKLFGWSADEAIGNSALDLIVPSSENDKIEKGISTLKQNTPLTQINQNATKAGQTIWCRWHNVPRKNAQGEVTEFHSIAIDVSEEAKNTMRLEKDRESALSASKAKDLLLASTSHEIRNPLNAIMGFTQLILDDSPNGETKDMAKVILNGAEDMLAILNDLLDSAKIESGKMLVNYSSVQLAECIQKEAKLFSQIIKEQGIEVSDTGVGMDDATLAQVFEPFTQGPRIAKHGFKGSVLGFVLN